MSHFTPAFIKFFKTLSQNNTTTWFNENRATYEKEVKKPFQAFVEEIIRRVQKLDPEVRITPADAIMRINKDIRFSKDKTPYNTHMSAIISATGKKDKSYPGLYIQASPEGVSLYGGAYAVETPVLQKMRSYMAGHLKAFAAAYNQKAFKEKFGHILGEANKRIPPELQAAWQKEPLLANKQFYFKAELKPALITADDLVDTVMAYYKAAKPVNDFLIEARQG